MGCVIALYSFVGVIQSKQKKKKEKKTDFSIQKIKMLAAVSNGAFKTIEYKLIVVHYYLTETL